MEHAGEIGTPSAPKGPQQLSTWQRMRGLVGLLVAVVAFYAVMTSMMSGGGGTSYFLDASEARAKLTALDGKTVRVKGNVIVGTYQRTEGTNDHRFDIEEKGDVIHVRFQGPMPDVFKEGMPVVAEGILDAKGQLAATEVVAKCPSKYEEGKVSQQAKEKMGTN